MHIAQRGYQVDSYSNGTGRCLHQSDVIMSARMSQILGVSIVCSTVCSDVDQRKHQSFTALSFVRGIHKVLGGFPSQRPVTRKMFPFDDVIMFWMQWGNYQRQILMRYPWGFFIQEKIIYQAPAKCDGPRCSCTALILLMQLYIHCVIWGHRAFV